MSSRLNSLRNLSIVDPIKLEHDGDSTLTYNEDYIAELHNDLYFTIGLEHIPVDVLPQIFGHIRLGVIENPLPFVPYWKYSALSTLDSSGLEREKQRELEYCHGVYQSLKIVTSDGPGRIVIYRQTGLSQLAELDRQEKECCTDGYIESVSVGDADNPMSPTHSTVKKAYKPTRISFLYQTYVYSLGEKSRYFLLVGRWGFGSLTNAIYGRTEHDYWLRTSYAKGKFLQREGKNFYIVKDASQDKELQEALHCIETFSTFANLDWAED